MVVKMRCFRDVFGLQAELRIILTNCGKLGKVRRDWTETVALGTSAVNFNILTFYKRCTDPILYSVSIPNIHY